MRVKLPNLNVLLQFQKRLDEYVIKKKNIKFPVVDLKEIAFKVEFGEFLNETQFFKFWKENPVPKDGMLEEFVDGIHFLLGIAIDRKWDKWVHAFDESSLEGTWEETTLTKISKDIFENPLEDVSDWMQCVCDYLQMAHMLGITVDDIEKAYLKKNKVNLDRQNNGY